MEPKTKLNQSTPSPKVQKNRCKRRSTSKWTEEDDNNLLLGIKSQHNGELPPSNQISWVNITNWVPRKTCVQIRERYTHVLDPRLLRGGLSREELHDLLLYHEQLGNKWTAIADNFSGRSSLAIKNSYYSLLRRFRRHKGRDPLQGEMRTLFFESAQTSGREEIPKRKRSYSEVTDPAWSVAAGISNTCEERDILKDASGSSTKIQTFPSSVHPIQNEEVCEESVKILETSTSEDSQTKNTHEFPETRFGRNEGFLNTLTPMSPITEVDTENNLLDGMTEGDTLPLFDTSPLADEMLSP